MLVHPTSYDVKNSYVHNRPMLCKRKDIGSELLNILVHDEDTIIIEKVSANAPEMSPSLRNKKQK